MRPEEQQALQTWLALEHEAVWLYGQIGARVRDLSGAARASYDAHRTELEATVFKGKKVEVSRFKGLGEMNPQQLRETTMSPETRSLIRITLPEHHEQRFAVAELVDQLMGRNPEHRFNFIQNRAGDVDREMIDA